MKGVFKNSFSSLPCLKRVHVLKKKKGFVCRNTYRFCLFVAFPPSPKMLVNCSNRVSPLGSWEKDHSIPSDGSFVPISCP